MFIPILIARIFSSCQRPEAADLVIRGGKIATVGGRFSIREAVAVRGGKIVYIGDLRGLKPFFNPGTRVLDAAGGLVLPGLTETISFRSGA